MLTVTDVNGGTATCTATVSGANTVRPIAICQNILHILTIRELNDHSEPDQQRLEDAWV